jgi:Flp pilus assembly protein TadD
MYSKAIDLNKESSSYYNNRGIAYKNLKEYDNALDDYTQAIKLKNNHPDYYFNRGIIHKQLGDLNVAI